MSEDISPVAQNELVDLLVKAYAEEKGLSGDVNYLKAAKLWQKAHTLGSQLAKDRLQALLDQDLVDEKDLKSPVADLKTTSKGQILLVEDGEDTRNMVAFLLKKAGFEPLSAENGVDALAKLQEYPHVCGAIVDLQMPHMNGFEFISTVRSQPSFKDLPFVILTAYTNKELVQKGRELKVKAWLTKPVKRELLHSIMDKHFTSEPS